MRKCADMQMRGCADERRADYFTSMEQIVNQFAYLHINKALYQKSAH
jgi:hypothetical protein